MTPGAKASASAKLLDNYNGKTSTRRRGLRDLQALLLALSATNVEANASSLMQSSARLISSRRGELHWHETGVEYLITSVGHYYVEHGKGASMSAQIMVINDTEEILELFRMLLEGEGYEVTLFSYAPKELDMLERHMPDLVILDLMFGRENLGWQLLEKMKLRRSTAAIPVIVCTAAIREVREIEGHLKSQGVVVVAKPFDIDTLLNAVQAMLTISDRSAGIQDAQEAQDVHEGQDAQDTLDAEQKVAKQNRKIS